MLDLALLPSLALYGAVVASAIWIVALRRRRPASVIASSIGLAAAGFTFWRWMDVRYEIPAAMLMWCCGLGLIVGRSMVISRPLRAQWLRFLGGSAGVVAPCFGFLVLTLPFRMWDETQMQARAPDGAYTATLSFKDGLTFGFQHVTIDARGWHLFGGHADVTEVACEGLQAISWNGNRTLVVDYDGTKHKNDLDDILFTEQDRHWRDIEIIYRDVSETHSNPAAATPRHH